MGCEYNSRHEHFLKKPSCLFWTDPKWRQDALFSACIWAWVQSCLTLGDALAYSPQAPLLLGSSRQEDWSGSPFPSAGDLPDPGVELASPALEGRIFTTASPGKPSMMSNQLASWKSKNRKLIYFAKVHWSVCTCLFCTWQTHWLVFTPEMDPQKEE